LDDSNLNDVFQLAQTFESHCAKVYDHASSHPDGAASADYVMQLVSQAYRAVHSLHMQKLASSYLDMGAATAALQIKATEYRESREVSPDRKTAHLPAAGNTILNANFGEDEEDADWKEAGGAERHERYEYSEGSDADSESESEELANTPRIEVSRPHEETMNTVPGVALENILDGDFEGDEEDSDWEESEEDSDDERYEYSEGSDIDSEDEIAETPTIEEPHQPIPEKSSTAVEPPIKVNNATNNPVSITEKQTPPPTTISIFKDQAMHDRITAALQSLSLPSNEEEIPLARVETQIDTSSNEPEESSLTRAITHIDIPNNDSENRSLARVNTHIDCSANTAPFTDTQSEDTAVQAESPRETTREPPATAPASSMPNSIQATRFRRNLSLRSSSGFPRRLKSVCSKFVGRAMVPIRGRAN
jgi:hypothetical protein